MVVHRSAQKEQGSRMKEMRGDDEEVHRVLLVIPPSTHIFPKFYNLGGKGAYYGNRSNIMGTKQILH